MFTTLRNSGFVSLYFNSLDLIFCCLKQLVLEKCRNFKSTYFQGYKLIEMSLYSEKFWFSLKCSSIMKRTVLLFNSSHFFRRSQNGVFFIVSTGDNNVFFQYQLTCRAWSPINVTYIQGCFLGIYKVAKKTPANQNQTSTKFAKTKNDNRKQTKNPTKI